MSSPVLSVLKYVFLAFLYLFFLRVLRAVWTELREPKTIEVHTSAPDREPAPSMPASYSHAGASAMTTMTPVVGARESAPHADETISSAPGPAHGRLVITAPPPLAGMTFPLDREVTIGRSPSSTVSLPEDTFVSSVHARVFLRDDDYELEDLGSTNGTFLNGERVHQPVSVGPGDRIQVGQTVLEMET